jgi:hypothetical protein
MRMKQTISINKLARRDIRYARGRLGEQETTLLNQQRSLNQAISRLQADAKRLVPYLKEKELEVPDPDFPLSDLEPFDAPEDSEQAP